MTSVALKSLRFLSLSLLGLVVSGPAALAQECQAAPSWIFRRSTYTHAPETGARVAQYQRIAPVEGLEDPRQFTSGYRRTRTTLRGADGSIDSTYQVQNWGNGRGGLDAEWERFHNAWQGSFLSGGSYSGYAAPYAPGYYGHVPYGYGVPPYGYPGPWGYGQGYPHAPHFAPGAGGGLPPWHHGQP